MSLTLSAVARRAALKEAVALLKSAGLDTPVLDARLIVQYALGVDWQALFLAPDQPLTDDERDRLARALERRLAREPVARIVGRRHFWTLDLAVSPATLDPRADTETVVEAALAAFPDRGRPLRALDLGTGTGAILLALLKEFPQASGVGVDRSPAAIAVAAANARNHDLADRVVFLAGDWSQALDGAFDLIVSNPPYIAHAELAGLAPEVRAYDPTLALDGGADGLDAYRAILPEIPRLTATEGFAILEVGAGQSDAVQRIAQGCGLALTARRADIGGLERALTFRPDGRLAGAP